MAIFLKINAIIDILSLIASQNRYFVQYFSAKTFPKFHHCLFAFRQPSTSMRSDGPAPARMRNKYRKLSASDPKYE
jgi:hypothetical protein